MAYSEAQEFSSAKPLPLTDRQASWIMGVYIIAGLLLPIAGPIIHIMSTNTQAPPAQVR